MRILIALSFIGLSTAAHSAARSVFESAKHVYAVMDLRQNLLSECAKQDPANTGKYNAETTRYRQRTKVLSEKVRQLIVAEVPSTPPEQSIGVIAKWSESESRRNLNFQLQPQHRAQFMQKCSYIIDPDNRPRSNAAKAQHNQIMGLPEDEWPADVRVINAWKP
ncbi:hypothetical protein SAMN05216374_3314 [Tardiphaga sp. OK246]|jgi:hypothetical protein|uniref:hypothetical protein n=1 Tax=Tardiphaga sp. OK246 TaxID=1855307 RepID=UPI000B6997BF|nr:hypothetical protein [Tardiphaga sp. OK246]SNT34178.1 hypothetical protein SAMN05216374_3314 [Tardiphaga sp. OK246]